MSLTQLDARRLRSLAEASLDFGYEQIPEYWAQLHNEGWRIEPTSCQCGGRWAWLDRNNLMFGCVCHHYPPTTSHVEIRSN